MTLGLLPAVERIDPSVGPPAPLLHREEAVDEVQDKKIEQ